ncbi:FCD domain-containing protein [Gallibacterium anatis]|uniref:GntR family transcriptional regulator n=1 Tax=Gallibacterium anatis TaxID=750 RepID=UPI000531ED86|nr:GntR family transcriptional regulator [Gallibacterium anatis]KGQ24507.1 GntR family transcriptional regulator [Gallibacterium anatis]KGQ44654.1 GntR family transcriptional regulator [Gallibacterium anatis]KGQ52364.1 GntR family transcriptional regulator [Gallibacterium anatis 10672-6]MBP4132880.1 GntR family transcriptional regulator [Gallibacterium anatis]
MSRDFELRNEVANQVMDAISAKVLDSPLPSQVILASLYNVSRTTIRSVLSELLKKGILVKQNENYVVSREPREEDKFTLLKTKQNDPKSLKKIESYFQEIVRTKVIKPGDKISELWLAKNANVDIFSVRAYLIQFSRFNLIKNLGRGEWQLVAFTPHYADKLFELREMLECHALNCFMNLPQSDVRWSQMRMLLQEHRVLREHISEQFTDFAKLDHQFHSIILSAADNPFINDFIELISIIFNFHYQWDNRDLKTRNILAVEEHLAVLVKIVSQDDLGAITELKRHLNTAKKSLMNSIRLVHQ